MAMILRSEEEKYEIPGAAELATMKRKWSPNLTARELQDALVAAVKPAESYRVRWVE